MSYDNTSDDWVTHSINMPFVLRCKTFVEEEMSRRSEVECMDAYNEDGKDSCIDTGSMDAGSEKKKCIEPTSNMGTNHNKLITKMINSNTMLYNNKRSYRKEYRKLCNDGVTTSLPSYRNIFQSMTE